MNRFNIARNALFALVAGLGAFIILNYPHNWKYVCAGGFLIAVGAGASIVYTWFYKP